MYVAVDFWHVSIASLFACEEMSSTRYRVLMRHSVSVYIDSALAVNSGERERDEFKHLDSVDRSL